MTEALEVQVKQFIEKNGLITSGDLVLAAVSGGADSMCLVELLLQLTREIDFCLRVIHVEHGIRGAMSLADAKYVADYCKKKSLTCKVVHVNAPAYAEEKGCSLEEGARVLRFKALESAADELESEMPSRTVRIALAHHREDQAETVLWQLIRGSALRGLGGIRVRRERFIRPLLDTTRVQIEAYARGHDICWREDATNADTAYTRNRLRLEVLPVLTELNAGAVKHLCESAWQLQEAEEYIERQAKKVYRDKVHLQPDGAVLIDERLCSEEPLLLRWVLYRALSEACGSARDLQAKHIDAIRGLFEHQVGHELSLPYNVQARRDYEWIELRKNRLNENDQTKAIGRVCMDIIEPEADFEISKKKYTKCFDYDKIKNHVQIRRRRPGDYLTIDAEGHTQKLKSFFVNEKIPAREREELLLLADGSHILWVIGYRISEYYKVDAHTKRILRVQYSGGKENE